MKCYNIFCEAREMDDPNGCRLYTEIGMKKCNARKLYNLWNSYIRYCAAGWVIRKWKEMKDKYHGRIK